MTRHVLVFLSLMLALGAFAAEAGAAALQSLPRLNGVRCRQVVSMSGLTGFSCGRPSDPRSYVVTIEVADHSPYGQRPEDVRSGSWVRTTRTGCAGNVYVMVVATRTDGDFRRARSEAAIAARRLARMNAASA
ncbi:MAG: hypothetical protein QOI71_2295 [Gaiellales bacterium]|jgi:hypothetical protein|nr:hypothetical protein [Gaiellales bacterium]